MYASNAAALHQTWHDSPENCEKCKTYLARRHRAHATQRRRIDALKIIKPACWTLGKPKLNRIAGSAFWIIRIGRPAGFWENPD